MGPKCTRTLQARAAPAATRPAPQYTPGEAAAAGGLQGSADGVGDKGREEASGGEKGSSGPPQPLPAPCAEPGAAAAALLPGAAPALLGWGCGGLRAAAAPREGDKGSSAAAALGAV
jgi:hypothetical protein